MADYDQVELRCIAHLSEDPGLIDAMTSGSDVHRTVAAAVYGIPPEEVTHTQREFCKMVSYGLAYGMEAYGLSQRLGVPVEEAAAIMESYFGAFPLVKQYMDHTVADAKIRGATRTLFGRIRPLPDLHSSNYRVRQAAERQAMNAGIQGLAADIFKLALVRLDRDLEAAAAGQPAGAPGPRRGDRRGGRGGGGRRAPPHRVRPHRGGRPQGPPHHLHGDGTELGRRQGLRRRVTPPGLTAAAGRTRLSQLVRCDGLARRHRWRRNPYPSNRPRRGPAGASRTRRKELHHG